VLDADALVLSTMARPATPSVPAGEEMS
jgi:hypothetical protein